MQHKTDNNKKFPPIGLPKTYAPEKIEIGDAFEFECIDERLKGSLINRISDIENVIDDIMKSCKIKMDRTKDEVTNQIKSRKAQHLDELTKLKFKKIEAEKQNTREDFLSKLKIDLVNVKAMVAEKDKELQNNQKTLNALENKVELLKDENVFLNNEIKSAKKYRLYLNNRLQELENEKKNSHLLNNTMDESDMPNKTMESPSKEKNQQSNDKLFEYFGKVESNLQKKVEFQEKQVRQKHKELAILQSFDNPIMKIFNKCIDEYEKNLLNSKLTNEQFVFQQDDGGTVKDKKVKKHLKNHKRSYSLESDLSKNDKKEIVKSFFDDMEVECQYFKLKKSRK